MNIPNMTIAVGQKYTKIMEILAWNVPVAHFEVSP